MTYHPSANLDSISGELPKNGAPPDVDKSTLANIAAKLMNNLDVDHLSSNAIWRDMLAFTDTFRTFYSPTQFHAVFEQLSRIKHRSKFDTTIKEPQLIENSWFDVDLTFTVKDGDLLGCCTAVVSLIYDDDGSWKIWMLRTWLECYEGFGHPDKPRLRSANGRTELSPPSHDHIYDVVIAGGGQSGLGVAGRCQALDVDYILFDERPAIGDSWSQRYDSLKWHTIKEYGNLPFGRTFEADQPMLLPAKQIGAGYKNWASKQNINAQEATSVKSARWDEVCQLWTVETSGKNGEQQWRCKNLVLCIGTGHKTPVVPAWAAETELKRSGFKGRVMHSVTYQNADDFAGKRGVVVGTANTGHDIAEDMANANMKTTMIQRGKTWVIPGQFLVFAHQHDYNLDKPVEEADREQSTQPLKVLSELADKHIHAGTKAQSQFYDDLEAAGFKVERYGRLFHHLFGRFGGHYVDIGNCSRIIKGEVKVKTEAVTGLTQDGLLFEDGSHLEADLIVLATGFEHDFRKDATEIVGHEVAAQMDDFWGLDKEGEIKGYAKIAGHPHLFYFGGEARNARFYSRFVALQLQKMKLGWPLKPYRGP